MGLCLVSILQGRYSWSAEADLSFFVPASLSLSLSLSASASVYLSVSPACVRLVQSHACVCAAGEQGGAPLTCDGLACQLGALDLLSGLCVPAAQLCVLCICVGRF